MYVCSYVCMHVCMYVCIINLFICVSRFPTVLMEDTAKSRDVLRCVLDSLQKSLGSGSPVPG